MKTFLLAVCFFTWAVAKAAPADTLKIYNPDADAEKDIAAAVQKAKAEHKFVLLQGGGNWCSWCMLFNKTITEDAKLDSIIQADFIVYHLNYSKENRNEKVFAKYGYPQRFGFPVFIILDETGSRIHTQNSEYLEEGKGYNKNKIAEFLEGWSLVALSSETYKLKNY